MKRNQLDRAADAPNPFAVIDMTPEEQARAQQQMDRATIVADLVIAVARRVSVAVRMKPSIIGAG